MTWGELGKWVIAGILAALFLPTTIFLVEAAHALSAKFRMWVLQ